MKRCHTCNEVFSELGDWQKICKPCFAKSKKAEKANTQPGKRIDGIEKGQCFQSGFYQKGQDALSPRQT